jgi:hypothetical protein
VPKLDEWDPLLLMIAAAACAETADGWVGADELAEVCAGLGRRAEAALRTGWAQAAAERGLVRTRARHGALELRPAVDVLSLLGR